MNKSIKTIYWLLLIIQLLLNIYYIYVNVLSLLIIDHGVLMIADGHYVPMHISLAIYLICFSGALCIATIGLMAKKQWAYYLFLIFAISAVIALALSCWLDYTTTGKFSLMDILALSAVIALIMIIILHKDTRPRKKGLLITLMGIFLNFAIFYFMLVLK